MPNGTTNEISTLRLMSTVLIAIELHIARKENKKETVSGRKFNDENNCWNDNMNDVVLLGNVEAKKEGKYSHRRSGKIEKIK